jgi:hypothetical protein
MNHMPPKPIRALGWRGLIRVAIVHVVDNYPKGVDCDTLVNEVSDYVREVLLAKVPQPVRDNITDKAIVDAIIEARKAKDIYTVRHGKADAITYHVCEGA